jgi:NAD(P)-dependent dehydrogenase (short-subunit alcohol dehydrogenase family)
MKLPENIVITGANGQTAVRIARELLQQRSRLLLIANRRTDRVEKLKAEFSDLCHVAQCDLSDLQQAKLAVQKFIKETGKSPTGLVHTAAIRSYDAQSLSESEPEIWKDVFHKNITMAYNILKCVLPDMEKQSAGKIVLFGSNVTRTGLPYGSAYAAAKSALANLVRSVAWETAALNIQVNIVSPAPLETKLEEDYEGNYLKFRQDYFEAYKNSHPAHKLVSLDNVTKVVLNLLDLEQKSLTGEEIYLTGGVL